MLFRGENVVLRRIKHLCSNDKSTKWIAKVYLQHFYILMAGTAQSAWLIDHKMKYSKYT